MIRSRERHVLCLSTFIQKDVKGTYQARLDVSMRIDDQGVPAGAGRDDLSPLSNAATVFGSADEALLHVFRDE